MKAMALGIAAAIVLAIGAAMILDRYQSSTTERYTVEGSVRR